MILFNEKMKYYSLIIASIIGITVLIYILTPLKSYSLGFLLGLVFGYVSLWTIYRKTISVGHAPKGRNKTSIFSLIIAGFGFVIRVGLAITAIWLALKSPDKVHLVSVIAGLSLIYIIILIDVIIQAIRKR